MAVAHRQVTHQHAARPPRFGRRLDWNGVVHFLLLFGRQRLAMEERETKRPHQQQVASHGEWLRPRVLPPRGPSNASKQVTCKAGRAALLVALATPALLAPPAVAAASAGPSLFAPRPAARRLLVRDAATPISPARRPTALPLEERGLHGSDLPERRLGPTTRSIGAPGAIRALYEWPTIRTEPPGKHCAVRGDLSCCMTSQMSSTGVTRQVDSNCSVSE